MIEMIEIACKCIAQMWQIIDLKKNLQVKLLHQEQEKSQDNCKLNYFFLI